MTDAIFEHPRLAAIYDALDGDRRDLDVYVAIADELGAKRVLDVGCGTGTFALMLAARGLDVTGVDPAAASLDVARAKPGSERVRWIHGDAASQHPLLEVDLVTRIDGVGSVESWVELTDVSLPLVSFRGTWVFPDREVLTSDSTLRFRERDEVEADLIANGYVVTEVRDAPDRPGREFVFFARRATTIEDAAPVSAGRPPGHKE